MSFFFCWIEREVSFSCLEEMSGRRILENPNKLNLVCVLEMEVFLFLRKKFVFF